MNTLGLTTKSYIKAARKSHGLYYDYSQVQYTKLAALITIVCPTHGAFQQSAGSHMYGKGCNACANVARGVKRKLTTEYFIRKARLVHGTKYSYKKVDCVSSKDKVIITCPHHGDFSQKPNNHLSGKGCNMCAGRFKDMQSGFIFKAKEVHGNLYDYSKVRYQNARTKVEVFCKKHGSFTVLPVNHLSRKSGCPSCGFEKVQATHYQNKQIILSDGRTVTVQGYEPFAIAYLENRKIKTTNLRFNFEVPTIRYKYKGKVRRYYPDLAYGNTVVEVKSRYTWKAAKEQNKTKLRAALAAGFNIRLLVFDADGGIIADVKRKHR